FNGAIDEVTIWDRALSGYEIYLLRGEECEGWYINETCASLGLGQGELECEDCIIDTSSCSECGNNITEVGEECDDGNHYNCDWCDENCRVEFCGDGRCCPYNPVYEACNTCIPDCGACCFVSGTKVLVNGKEKNIEEVRVGERVNSYGSEGEVLQKFEHWTSGYLIINGKLKVTAEHPMMVNGEWEKIGNAKFGDVLQTLTGSEIIWSIVEVDEPVKVYNLEVSGSHNYFADGYLVHNKPPLEPEDPEQYVY
ncbi:MAG: polymorphic toxin-type HINT domain-containing protein, partial [Nanoarchaeota archaeon]